MPRYVALLRGINVGANKRIRMEDLRNIVASLGYQGVRTHLNSGNVVFTAGQGIDVELVESIERAITSALGMDVPVIVRSGDEMQQIVANNPFPQRAADPRTLHVSFMAETPDPAAVEALADLEKGADDYRVIGTELYLSYPNKITGAVFVPTGLNVVCTSRNWRTVTRLAAMTGE